MSFIAHGLQCTNDECALVDNHVFYRKSEGPPACPDCDSPRKIYWGHGRFPGVSGDGLGTFVPVDMGVLGKCETREEYNRAVGVIKKRFPGHSVVVEGDSPAKREALADEHRQRSHDRLRGHGLTKKMHEEVKEMRKAEKSAAKREALRHNKNPTKVKTSTKSFAATAGVSS